MRVVTAVLALLLLMPTIAQASDGVWYASRAERVLAGDINMSRFKVGARPLVFHRALSAVAAKRSRDMIKKNYFAHSSPTGVGAADIMRKMKLSFDNGAEDIVKVIRCDRNLKPVRVANIFHWAWMHSTPHREAMLKKKWTHMGVAIVHKRITDNCMVFVGTLIVTRR